MSCLRYHPARNGPALPIDHLAVGVISRFQKDITRLAARVVLLRFAAQQDRLIPDDISQNGDHGKIGLHVIEHFAVGGKVPVCLR